MNSGNQTSLSNDHCTTTTYLSLFWRLSQDIQILVLLMALSILVTLHALRQSKHQGLAVWPVVGMLPSLLLGLRNDAHEWLTGVLRAQGGTFTFRGPWFTNLQCVVTADPRNLEHILKTKFSNFPKGEYFRNIASDMLGDGFFNSDGEVWRRQRKTLSLEVHSADFRSATTQSVFEIVHSRLLPVLELAHDNQAPFDLQDVLLRLAFDNLCMVAFGIDPGCLRPELPEVPFARALENATEATLRRFVVPTAMWKVLRFFDLGNERRLKRWLKCVDKFAYDLIRTRKEEMESGVEEKKSARCDLLTAFMKLKDENGMAFSDKFLRDVCINVILAGRDSTSVVLSWFFWLLNRHPEVEDKILEEIRRMVEERKNNIEGEGGKSLVFETEEVKRMEYLQAALSESLRLYPAVPVDHKEVVEDDVLPDGTILKPGTKVIYATYSMGRMESIWGKDCRDYKPERWLKDGRFMSESAYKFPAFNAGPRLCLGKDFAYYQMKFIVASILYRYHVKVVESHPVVPKLALTMYIKYGLKVTLSVREDSKLLK
uniref:Cytochrome P450 86B1-like n=1 Tax=Elaeis guineensis var. tenera TaxID=51953 RepID=A0A6I9QAD5_ELAGV|nr:cytochrome P450 86B1-like [Elaeis guineensis]